MSATTTAGASAHGLVYAFENVPGVDERVELAQGVYWLRMPFEFGINHINLWLLEDDEGWTVIDTGFDRDSIRRIW